MTLSSEFIPELTDVVIRIMPEMTHVLLYSLYVTMSHKCMILTDLLHVSTTQLH